MPCRFASEGVELLKKDHRKKKNIDRKRQQSLPFITIRNLGNSRDNQSKILEPGGHLK